MQIPGVLVDCVVVAEPENHRQTYATAYNHAFSGRQRVPLDRVPPLPLGRAQDRRAPVRLRAAARRRGESRHRHAGGRGGRRRRGEGAQIPDAHGGAGHHRRAAAGRAQLRRGPQSRGGDPPEPAVRLLRRRRAGSRLPGAGAGGCARATSTSASSAASWRARAASSTSARTPARLVFAGTFTAGGLEIAVEDGRLRIVREGKSRKFVEAVEQITFSGAYAAETGQPVFYVTERCVFRRTPAGMELTRSRRGSTSSATSWATWASNRSCVIQSPWTRASSASR